MQHHSVICPLVFVFLTTFFVTVLGDPSTKSSDFLTCIFIYLDYRFSGLRWTVYHLLQSQCNLTEARTMANLIDDTGKLMDFPVILIIFDCLLFFRSTFALEVGNNLWFFSPQDLLQMTQFIYCGGR